MRSTIRCAVVRATSSSRARCRGAFTRGLTQSASTTLPRRDVWLGTSLRRRALGRDAGAHAVRRYMLFIEASARWPSSLSCGISSSQRRWRHRRRRCGRRQGARCRCRERRGRRERREASVEGAKGVDVTSTLDWPCSRRAPHGGRPNAEATPTTLRHYLSGACAPTRPRSPGSERREPVRPRSDRPARRSTSPWSSCRDA